MGLAEAARAITLWQEMYLLYGEDGGKPIVRTIRFDARRVAKHALEVKDRAFEELVEIYRKDPDARVWWMEWTA